MGHVILLGDSIFDNARYVPDRPAVIDQLRRGLPKGWTATLLAIDGSTTQHVPEQLRDVPADATHLVVSVGGNDALTESGVLRMPAATVADAMELLAESAARFESAYRAMLTAVLALGKPTAVCTVYDEIPGLSVADRTALSAFNAIILREAIRNGLPVIDLRLVCDRADDYSPLSPIEPSMAGGSKITRVIAEMLAAHDFASGRSTIYVK